MLKSGAFSKTRNAICSAIALFLLKSDSARRAFQRARSGDVITAVYFHKPNRKLFSESVTWLRRNGYSLIGLEELVEILYKKRPFPNGPTAWLSLDDGYKEWLNELLPVIREHKVPVTLFIPSGIVGGDGSFPWLRELPKPSSGTGADHGQPVRGSLTVNELKELASCPEVQIGAHTVNHTRTTDCTKEELDFEIGECQQVLQEWTGQSVLSFSYPEGYYDGRERRALRKFDYVVAATTEPSFIDRDTDPMLVPRFCVPDTVSLSEAICNMVGIWHPVVQPIKALALRRSFKRANAIAGK